MGEPRASWNVIPLLSQEQMSFYVGQRVVCVDDAPSAYRCVPLIYGQEYTVRAIVDSGRAIWLVGVHSLYEAYGKGFRSERFRPLDTLTEDMERIEAEGCPLEPEHA